MPMTSGSSSSLKSTRRPMLPQGSTLYRNCLLYTSQQVADGVLASANSTLKEGGLIDNDMTWNDYASVIDNILTMNDKTLTAGRRKIVRTVWEQEPSFKDSELDLALYLAATKTNHDLEAALKRMQSYDQMCIRDRPSSLWNIAASPS